ncbi:hypothetical protein ACN47E_008647 [Coniothyrium glycines]
MRLLDLPPEILDLIIDRTLPHGIESFVLSCKAVHRRATSQIERHNALKQRWRRTTNVSPIRRGDTLSIIREIAREPQIAHYIQSLDLWEWRVKSPVSSSHDDDDFRNHADTMETIKTLLRSTEYFAKTDLESWWENMLQEDRANDDDHLDKLYATIALLALLPNLQTLQLPDRWHEVRNTEAGEGLVPAIEAMVALANAEGHQQKPLAGLHTIFPFVEEGYDVRVGLQCLQPFMTLKSLKNLYAVSCVAIDEDWLGLTFHWPNPSIKSSLTRIEFASCCMNAGGLAHLLPNTTNLAIFRYSHQTKWDGLEHDWNPGELLEILANYCSETLTELAITIDELHGEIENGLSSFMRLPHLSKLEVDVQAFCGPPLESGQRLGRNARVPPGQDPWTYLDIPCMGDMLPPSVRELHVNTDFPEPAEQALRSLFKNIVDRRKDKLILLQKVVIRQYRSTSAKVMADEHAVILEGFDEGVENPRPRSMMPQWKREFDATVGGIVSADD